MRAHRVRPSLPWLRPSCAASAPNATCLLDVHYSCRRGPLERELYDTFVQLIQVGGMYCLGEWCTACNGWSCDAW